MCTHSLYKNVNILIEVGIISKIKLKMKGKARGMLNTNNILPLYSIHKPWMAGFGFFSVQNMLLVLDHLDEK